MSNYLEYRLKLKNEGKPPKEKKVYRIPRESKKRAKINREYAKKSRPVWRGGALRDKIKGLQWHEPRDSSPWRKGNHGTADGPG